MDHREPHPRLILLEWLRCWPGPARGLLIASAVPLAGWLAWSSPGEAARPAFWPSLVVDPNSAPAPVLEALPGLGPALAGRIVAARAVLPFRSIADLDRRVKGIGPAKAAALLPYFKFASGQR